MLRALRNFRDQTPELQPWSLKFTDGWLERRFQDEYFDTNQTARFEVIDPNG